MDLRYWLIGHGISRSKIGRKPIQFSLDPYRQKSFRSSEYKSNPNHRNRVTAPQPIPRIEPVCKHRTLRMKESGSSQARTPLYCPKYVLSIFVLAIPKGPTAFTKVTVHWEKGTNQTF